MTRAQYERKARQRRLRKQFILQMISLGLVVLVIMIIALRCAIVDESKPEVIDKSQETAECYETATTPTQIAVPNETYPTTPYSKSISGYETYLLAKIVMAEAEGESLELKEAVVKVVLNRVEDTYFPDTIEDVIFQKLGGVYQFSPIANGRWDRVEPTEECFTAVDNVLKQVYDDSMGATYFEACSDADNWHSQNLEFLYEIDGTRFYK